MFNVKLQFANHYEAMEFSDRISALSYARDLLDMFKGEEMFLSGNTYIVTVPRLEIVK